MAGAVVFALHEQDEADRAQDEGQPNGPRSHIGADASRSVAAEQVEISEKGAETRLSYVLLLPESRTQTPKYTVPFAAPVVFH